MVICNFYSVVCCETTRPEPNTNKRIIQIEYFGWWSLQLDNKDPDLAFPSVDCVGCDHDYRLKTARVITYPLLPLL